LLNDQGGSVLGDSTVFSWAGCHSRHLPTASSSGGEIMAHDSGRLEGTAAQRTGGGRRGGEIWEEVLRRRVTSPLYREHPREITLTRHKNGARLPPSPVLPSSCSPRPRRPFLLPGGQALMPTRPPNAGRCTKRAWPPGQRAYRTRLEGEGRRLLLQLFIRWASH
jgi:hypothetical protein